MGNTMVERVVTTKYTLPYKYKRKSPQKSASNTAENQVKKAMSDALKKKSWEYWHSRQPWKHVHGLVGMSVKEIERAAMPNRGQTISISLQKGDDTTKMVTASTDTIYQLKQKYIECIQQNHGQAQLKVNDIVLLFMGQALNDEKMLDYYKIGCTKESTIFVAERIRCKSEQSTDEGAGMLFINKNDGSEHILYVDPSMAFRDLKKIYKDYLMKQYGRTMMKEQMQKLSSQSVSFECSGKTFEDQMMLKECGIGSTDLQYIFVSFADIIKEEQNNTDEECMRKMYGMTSKEYAQATAIKEKFDEALKSTNIQKSLKEIGQTFKEMSTYEVDKMKSYPEIQDIVQEQTSENRKKATEYTKEIMCSQAKGKLGSDVNITLHIINSVFKSIGDECVFYDSRKDIKLKAGDSGCAFHEMFEKDKPFILRLETLDGLYASTDDIHQSDELEYKCMDYTNALIAMQCAIENSLEHPTLFHVKNKLSAALGVAKDRINIIQVFSGSDCFKYTVANLTDGEKQRLIQTSPTQKLQQQFSQFISLKIHPLLYRPAFDVANFDQRGNKSFVSKNGKFQVGPTNMKKEYIQPTGWTRYGLSVLGKYGNDQWLHPFNDSGNWWRAFHGTARAAKYNVDPIDAMVNIHNHGFLPAKTAYYGPGVYCSPKPQTAESYATKISMPIVDNGQQVTKEFKFMLQLAVKPGDNTLTARSTDTVWSVQNKDHLRAYGILIKEV